MQGIATHSIDHSFQRKQCRYYRIERQYSSQRPLRELVRDLLRAHSGE